jgi:ribosomal protein L7/L12
MPIALTCPNCGAPLQAEKNTANVTCNYCKAQVLIPEDNREIADSPKSAPQLSITNLQKLAEVKRLVQSGNKIGAIRLLREIMPLSLAEATQAVEAIERGETLTFTNVNVLDDRNPPSSASPTDFMQAVQAEVQKGNKINAIKIYRDATGANLQESKLAVETLEAQLGTTKVTADNNFPKSRINCGGCMALSIGIIVTVLLAVGVILFSLRDSNIFNLIQTISTATPAPFSTIGTIGNGEGSGAGYFMDGRLVTANANFIYTGEYENARVQAFSPAGAWLHEFQVVEPLSTHNYLSSIAINAENQLFVALSGNLFKLDYQNGEIQETLWNYHETDISVDEISINRKNILFAAGDDVLLWWAQDGTLLHRTDDWAQGLETTFTPSADKVVIDDQANAYIFDQANNRIFIFNAQGQLIDQLFTEDEASGMSLYGCMAVDPAGNLVANSSDGWTQYNQQLQIIQTGGTVINAESCVFSPQGILYAFDRNLDKIVQIAP